MPKFPTYEGEIPPYLHPLNPRHWLLLANWIYRRPTALKCYLYQANSELYWEEKWVGISRAWLVPAYRNLYLCIPLVCLSLTFLLSLPISIVSWFQGNPPDLFSLVSGALSGVVLGVVLGMVWSVTFGTMFGMWRGVALGVAWDVTLGVAWGMVGGVMVGVASGMTDGVVFSVVFFVVFGMAWSVVWGMVWGVVWSVVWSVVLGIVVLGVTSNVVWGVVVSAGALRIPFYLFYLGERCWSSSRAEGSAWEWDELMVLSLPSTQNTLLLSLEKYGLDRLHLMSTLVRNPFQRWAVQKALMTYLHNQIQPLNSLYALLINPHLDVYILAPLLKKDWKELPAQRQVLLGELGHQWVDCSSGWTSRFAERLVYDLTSTLRDHRQTPFTRFTGMLYDLLDAEKVNAKAFNLSEYRIIYADISAYPGGTEIVYSFDAMHSCLDCQDLSALPNALSNELEEIPQKTAIRPTVLITLKNLRHIGIEVAGYLEATSRVNKLASIARAIDALDILEEYINAEVVPPEQTILKRIIRQWRKLVSEAGGAVGRTQEIGPIANPYVAGNPVTGGLFVGREDILRRLEVLWMESSQCPSVILYGHRRMGKSSILKNLAYRFGTQTTIIDFNMQLVGHVANTGELLYNLSLALYDSLPATQQAQLAEPNEDQFLKNRPYTPCNRWLNQLDKIRAGQRFIITIDEFELIEAMMQQGHLDPYLLDYLRALIQAYPWLILTFAGLHTLQEMTQDYWNPLFGSVTVIPVSFLSPKAAERLIVQPSPDFNLDYDADAIQQIIQLTNGQPYLTQLVGHTLVTRFNRQTFEEGIERDRRFTIQDVEAVITAPEFYRDGNAYFTGVWRQAETSDPEGQTAILKALSQAHLSATELAEQTYLRLDQIQAALKTLENHDVLVATDGTYTFTVELMRRWVADYQNA